MNVLTYDDTITTEGTRQTQSDGGDILPLGGGAVSKSQVPDVMPVY